MRKLAVIGSAVTVALAGATTAAGQVPPPVIQVAGFVTPSKGGSAKRPRNAHLKMAFTVNPDSRSTVDAITFLTPARVPLTTKGFARCGAARINDRGRRACPRGSQVGEGTASAVVGPQRAPVDFDFAVYAAGSRSITVALRQTNPAGPLTVAFRARLARARGAYGTEVTVPIPRRIQQPAPGLFAYITGVNFEVGARRVQRRGSGPARTAMFAPLRGCPRGGRHRIGVELHYTDNDTGEAGVSPVTTDTAACER